jgi:hypothetical protein
MALTHLRASLERYLNQQGSLRDIEEWLLTHLQDILDSGNQQAVELANQVDADIVEFGEGLLDEAMLKARFVRYLTGSSISSEYRTQGNSETDLIFSPVGVPGAEMTVHFRHVVVA